MCRAPVGDGAKRTRTGPDESELTVLIGAHVSTAGGLSTAIERAEEARCDAIQIFNQSPRMWRPTRYTEEDFAAFREAMAASKVQAVFIHMIYLINPAAKDREMRKKSLESLTHALQVGEGIGALGVVVHPGALKDDTRTNARKRAVKLIKEALARTESCPIIYENTAGSPQLLGRDFDETAELIEMTGGPRRLGLCIDSCHLYATGYDVARGDEGPGRRDRREGGAEAAQGPARERRPRPTGFEPRSPRGDRPGHDRAQGTPRLPR
jgi:deoxyribonuclease-4